MHFKTQLTGLTALLTALSGTETRVSTLLSQLGFTTEQIAVLRDQHLAPIVAACLSALQEQLVAHPPRGRLYTILCRRYGLDGHAPEPLRILADRLGVSLDQVQTWEMQALDRCRQPVTLRAFTTQLHRVALAQLGTLDARTPIDQIQAKLDRLADVRQEAERTRQAYDARRAEILRVVQADLDALEAEYQPLFEAVAEGMARLEDEIKNDVLLHGATVQSTHVRAVYTKGSVRWDTKALTRYAETHPELLDCRKQGTPTVSLRLLTSTMDPAPRDSGAGSHA